MRGRIAEPALRARNISTIGQGVRRVPPSCGVMPDYSRLQSFSQSADMRSAE